MVQEANKVCVYDVNQICSDYHLCQAKCPFNSLNGPPTFVMFLHDVDRGDVGEGVGGASVDGCVVGRRVQTFRGWLKGLGDSCKFPTVGRFPWSWARAPHAPQQKGAGGPQHKDQEDQLKGP